MALTQVQNLSLVQTAFERYAYFSLRPQMVYIDLCDVKPTNESTNYVTVQFQITADLPAASSPIPESVDISPVALSDSNVTVTCLEYGNAVQTTARLRAGAYMEINPIVAEIIGYNAGISLDTVARNTFQTGTNVYLSGGVTNRNLLTTSGTTYLTGKDGTRANKKLAGLNVMPFGDGTYRGIIHPDVAFDFQTVTGGNNWSDPHVFSDPSGIYNGKIGQFQGVTYLQTPRAPIFTDVGNGAGAAGPVDAYRTIILGRQAVACGYSQGGGYTSGMNPTYVQIPEIDTLRRYDGTGWKWLGGFSIFRQQALFNIESSSSLGNNT